MNNSGGPEPDATARVREQWTTGSYANLDPPLLEVAARLVDATGVAAGDRVLDVACGTGNVALTAHRREAEVAGLDITPAMLDVARERAAVIDADVDWREGDAAALPFEDDAFDVTLSCLGHAMVPDAGAAAAELVRVTRPGGRIGFVVQTAGSSVAAMMAVLSEYLPERSDALPSPFRWGEPDTVRERFGDGVEDLRFETGAIRVPALSPAHYWASLTTDSGPVILALDSVDEARRPELRERVIDVLEAYFSEDDNAIEIEYRLVTATVA